MPTILKKCPNCGKRFEVQHTGESVERKEEIVTEEKTALPYAGIAGSYPIPVIRPSDMQERVMVEAVVEKDVYTETYKCKHCGHTWTEEHEKVKEVGEAEDSEVGIRPPGDTG